MPDPEQPPDQLPHEQASGAALHEAPLYLHRAEVLPEWVDYNGHMSEAFYVLIFGHATDALLDYIGMDTAFREQNRMSFYTLEAHVSYLKEAHEAEPLRVTTQLLDLDRKRAHVFHAMYSAQSGDGGGSLLATGEVMLLNVLNDEEAGPRSEAFPEEVAARLRGIREAHNGLPRPEQAGRSVGIRR